MARRASRKRSFGAGGGRPFSTRSARNIGFTPISIIRGRDVVSGSGGEVGIGFLKMVNGESFLLLNNTGKIILHR